MCSRNSSSTKHSHAQLGCAERFCLTILLVSSRSRRPNERQLTREGAMAVILSLDRRQVLLLRREIFWLWDLPGGGIERNETPAAAAVRETREETGYDITIDGVVGRYIHQSVYGRGDQLTHVFHAHVIGGHEKKFGLESSGLRWFSVAELPRGLQPLQRQMIADALADAPVPFRRHIYFPRWQLLPARLIFFFFSRRNNAIRRIRKWVVGRGR